jgi:hypothetical protein
MGNSSLAGLMRRRIGCFADQVYPIYALAKFSQAFGSDKALRVSSECAAAICRLQGPLGQWWWHYDAATCRVIGWYPVYSVHQDGMAPMALIEVGKVSGEDFSNHIYKGLKWITGENELDFNMIDSTNNVIWRSLYDYKYKLYINEFMSLIGFDTNIINNALKVRYECRAYHLGWLLYAFSNVVSTQK